jgi:hypothetical protein
LFQQATDRADFTNGSENEFVLNAGFQVEMLCEVAEFNLYLFDIQQIGYGDLAYMGDMGTAEFDIPVFDVDFAVGKKSGYSLQDTAMVIACKCYDIAFAPDLGIDALVVIGLNRDAGISGVKGLQHTLLHLRSGNGGWECGSEHDGKIAGNNRLAYAVDVGAKVGDGGGNITQNAGAIRDQDRNDVAIGIGFHNRGKLLEGFVQVNAFGNGWIFIPAGGEFT